MKAYMKLDLHRLEKPFERVRTSFSIDLAVAMQTRALIRSQAPDRQRFAAVGKRIELELASVQWLCRRSRKPFRIGYCLKLR